MSRILEIACDEAGYTGSDLLQKDQQIFAFSSVAIGDTEALEIIQKTRVDYPVQMPELKASKLLATERGRELIASLLAALDGRYVVSVNNKLLALCGWFFEYIYEPVYQHNSRILYEKNFHRFIAMYIWLWMSDEESNAKHAIGQFQKYMRSRNPDDAPFLFNNQRPPLSENGTEHPFECVLRFAYGYRDIIAADNARINLMPPDAGRWVLDLSAAGLWSHLNHWGRKGQLLSIQCDSSKPLKAIAPAFTGDDLDPAIRRARMMHSPEPLGWRMHEPLAFVDSRDHPAIQLADVVAGSAVALFTKSLPGCNAILDSICRHCHHHSILPDMEVIDPANRTAAVNALIAYDLAKRAELRANPHENLEAIYHFAEVSFAKGEYEIVKNEHKPLFNN